MTSIDLDTRRFRDAMGCYASGITVVTSLDEDTPLGFTCQSFFSLSLDPPLVCFAVQKTASTWPKIRGQERFAIDVLSRDQVSVSRRFGMSAAERWIGTNWSRSSYGNPALEGALLHLDCTLYAEHEAGDHWLVVANVHSMLEHQQIAEASPLLYYRGRYHQAGAL